jgi:hypothetical protein
MSGVIWWQSSGPWHPVGLYVGTGLLKERTAYVFRVMSLSSSISRHEERGRIFLPDFGVRWRYYTVPEPNPTSCVKYVRLNLQNVTKFLYSWWKVNFEPTVLGIPGSGSVFRCLLRTRNVVLMNACILDVFLFVAFKKNIFLMNTYSHMSSVFNRFQINIEIVSYKS